MTWTTPAGFTLQNSANVPSSNAAEKELVVIGSRQAKDPDSLSLEHPNLGVALYSLSRKLLTLNAFVIEERGLATGPNDAWHDYEEHLRDCVSEVLRLCVLEIVAISKMPRSPLQEITQEVLNNYDPRHDGDRLRESSEEALLTGSLSPRELQVVQLLAQGKCNKEIAATFDLSTKTVATYRERIMLKLNTHSMADLVRFAVRNKLASL